MVVVVMEGVEKGWCPLEKEREEGWCPRKEEERWCGGRKR